MEHLKNYFEKTELILDLIGPVIDISQIPEFKNIDSVRFLHEKDIANIINKNFSGSKEWTEIMVLERTLDAITMPKLCMQLIDKKMLELICRAKGFCTIKILTGMYRTQQEIDNLPEKTEEEKLVKEIRILKNKIYEATKEFLVKSSELYLKFINCKSNEIEKYKLLETDFEPHNINDYLSNTAEGQVYRIFFDDSINYEILSKTADKVQKWISGIDTKDSFKELEEILEERKRIEKINSIITELAENQTINLKKYCISTGKFYVFDKDTREKINSDISAVEAIVQNGKQKHRPICIFLAGSPGTGKSYFVKCFAKKMNANENYPVTSLSGVAADKFYTAINMHIKKAFDQSCKDEKTPTISFLDEVDTKGDHLAFRLLMDAMTGTKTDEYGMEDRGKSKSSLSSNLIWFFAGSGGVTREEFIKKFRDTELKITDFFDRIHFDIKLPAVDDSGQAILTFLSSFGDLIDKNEEFCVCKRVLRLFGCTKWESARQIITICRVANAKNKLTEDGAKKILNFEFFRGINLCPEFTQTYNAINAKYNTPEPIKVEW